MQFLEFTGSTLKKSLQLQLYPPSKFLHLCIQSLTGSHSFISKSLEANVIINAVTASALSTGQDWVCSTRSKPLGSYSVGWGKNWKRIPREKILKYYRARKESIWCIFRFFLILLLKLVLFNKLRSVFYASAPLLIINCVIKLSTWLCKLWQCYNGIYHASITGLMHKKNSCQFGFFLQ